MIINFQFIREIISPRRDNGMWIFLAPFLILSLLCLIRNWGWCRRWWCSFLDQIPWYHILWERSYVHLFMFVNFSRFDMSVLEEQASICNSYGILFGWGRLLWTFWKMHTCGDFSIKSLETTQVNFQLMRSILVCWEWGRSLFMFRWKRRATGHFMQRRWTSGKFWWKKFWWKPRSVGQGRTLLSADRKHTLTW